MTRSTRPLDPELNPPQIHNVVITTHAQRTLPLDHIAANATNVNYDRTRFAAVIMRCDSPFTTALFFNTGKIVCTGAKSVESAHRALGVFVARLRSVGVTCDPAPFVVENIVGASGFAPPSLHFRVRLDRIAQLERSAEYEPELFPGLTRRVRLPGGTTSVVVVFASGKMIFTGNRCAAHLAEAFRFVQGWLPDYAEPRKRSIEVDGSRPSVRGRRVRRKHAHARNGEGGVQAAA